MSFEEITLKSWDELHPYAQPLWLYRGQRCAEWELATSLERFCDRENVSPSERNEFEKRMLREFKRVYHHYTLHVPNELSILEWLSLMQHHGAPTRLLDFTYSIYVAAYFALEQASTDCAIWAVYGRWAQKESITLLSNAGKPNAQELNQKLERETDEGMLRPLFFEEPYVSQVHPLNPFRLNERLRIQKGAFLVPGNIEVPFQDNLLALPEHNDPNHLLKIIIPNTLRREALRELFYMNITRTSLFPGLDGYAQSLGIYHSIIEPYLWI